MYHEDRHYGVLFIYLLAYCVPGSHSSLTQIGIKKYLTNKELNK